MGGGNGGCAGGFGVGGGGLGEKSGSCGGGFFFLCPPKSQEIGGNQHYIEWGEGKRVGGGVQRGFGWACRSEKVARRAPFSTRKESFGLVSIRFDSFVSNG